jgi:hypothetical protein
MPTCAAPPREALGAQATLDESEDGVEAVAAGNRVDVLVVLAGKPGFDDAGKARAATETRGVWSEIPIADSQYV